jgi:energy-coupling factor transporter transmembrane protein EcfT
MAARLGRPGGLKPGGSRRSFQQVLVEASPLRGADPRVKLAMVLGVSTAVMLPLERLGIFLILYILLMLWARLLTLAAWQVWRLRWVLILLFAFDAWFVSLEHAATITLRIALLSGLFTLFFSTTTTGEFSLALEKLGVPYRYAFSLSLAVASLRLLDDEWRSIREAQEARGIIFGGRSLREVLRQAREMTALTVPVIVLTTKRAWAVNEAAHARGFDSPRRRPYVTLRFSRLDVVLLGLTILGLGLLYFWR